MLRVYIENFEDEIKSRKVDETATPRRRFKKNSPFSKEETAFIVKKFAEVKDMKKIQKLFRSKFFPRIRDRFLISELSIESLNDSKKNELLIFCSLLVSVLKVIH